MLWKLFLLFVILPLVELALLLYLGELTHWWVSLLVVILTGLVGAALARSQGWHTMRRIQRELAEGQLPADAMLDAVLIFLAGALLLTPGMITDAVGLSLLVPPCRRWYKKRLVNWFQRRFSISAFGPSGGPTGAGPQRTEVIDSYVVSDSTEEENRPD